MYLSQAEHIKLHNQKENKENEFNRTIQDTKAN